MGRHKMSRKTIEEIERDDARAAWVGAIWAYYYREAKAAGEKERAARKDATEAAAARFGLTPRRVQQICRNEREIDADRERLRQRLMNDPRRGLRRLALRLLTDEQLEWIDSMPGHVGYPLLQALVQGADAVEENRRLRLQLQAWRQQSQNSAKSKQR